MITRPYCGITDPVRADRFLTLMMDKQSVTNGKGFRSAPSGKHHKGRIHKPTAVEKLAVVAYGR